MSVFIQRYKGQTMNSDQLRSLVSAATRAPSGHNTQPWHSASVRTDYCRPARRLYQPTANQPLDV
ncbi:nitroreductase family protein [Kingella denitrificans]